MIEVEFGNMGDAIIWSKSLHDIDNDISYMHQWIHPAVAHRWHYLDAATYVMRQQENGNFKIREGRYDYYVLGKNKGENIIKYDTCSKIPRYN